MKQYMPMFVYGLEEWAVRLKMNGYFGNNRNLKSNIVNRNLIVLFPV